MKTPIVGHRFIEPDSHFRLSAVFLISSRVDDRAFSLFGGCQVNYAEALPLLNRYSKRNERASRVDQYRLGEFFDWRTFVIVAENAHRYCDCDSLTAWGADRLKINTYKASRLMWLLDLLNDSRQPNCPITKRLHAHLVLGRVWQLARSIW
jgi:hypothetical protein